LRRTDPSCGSERATCHEGQGALDVDEPDAGFVRMRAGHVLRGSEQRRADAAGMHDRSAGCLGDRAKGAARTLATPVP
jgi:hypothetical protein